MAATVTASAWADAPRAADPPDPGSTQTLQYGSGPNAYPYIVYVPTTYDRMRPAPLVVMTHGCQTTADQQMRANLYNRVAEREHFVVLYPDVDAIAAQQPGPTARCWRFPVPASWHRDSGDAAAIAGMTRAVMVRWRIDSERVYMVGMSAGAFMTSIMAAAYPDLYAAVAINAGGAYADPECLVGNPVTTPVEVSAQLAYDEMGSRARVVPRLVTGGDADQGIAPPCADKALAQGLRTNNLVISGSQDGPIPLRPSSVREEPKPGGYASTVSTYRDPAGCIVGERWLIHGMNHFWPGGSSDPKLADFTDPKGPNGAEISWRFLARYTKRETAMPCAEAPAAPAAPAPAVSPRPRYCRRREVLVALPRQTRAARATVNGRRVAARITRGRLRLVLPAGRRVRTVVVIHARTRSGRAVTRVHRYRGCGP
jgi:poly(hydroxyalkanoate) depolymerase family esterase